MMHTLRRFFAFASLLLLVLFPLMHASAADDAAEAKRRFGEGTKAMAEGRFREAALHFEAASRLRPHGVASFTAAVAWDKAEDPARAADNFSKSLELPGLPPKEQKVAKERLSTLEESLGTAKIEGPSSLSVQFEGLTEAHPPVKLHATPGVKVLLIVRDDKVERRDVILKAGQTIELDVTEALEVAKPTASVSASASAPPPPPPPPPKTEPKPGMSTRKLIGFGAMGAGVISGGVAIALGFKTLSKRDDYEANPTREGYDSAVSSRTWTNVAWAGAVVLGGVGAALVFWPEGKKAKESDEEKASISLSPTLGGVQLGGTF